MLGGNAIATGSKTVRLIALACTGYEAKGHNRWARNGNTAGAGSGGIRSRNKPIESAAVLQYAATHAGGQDAAGSAGERSMEGWPGYGEGGGQCKPIGSVTALKYAAVRAGEQQEATGSAGKGGGYGRSVRTEATGVLRAVRWRGKAGAKQAKAICGELTVPRARAGVDGGGKPGRDATTGAAQQNGGWMRGSWGGESQETRLESNSDAYRMALVSEMASRVGKRREQDRAAGDRRQGPFWEGRGLHSHAPARGGGQRAGRRVRGITQKNHGFVEIALGFRWVLENCEARNHVHAHDTRSKLAVQRETLELVYVMHFVLSRGPLQPSGMSGHWCRDLRLEKRHKRDAVCRKLGEVLEQEREETVLQEYQGLSQMPTVKMYRNPV
ncbi:hypothetical protein B0H19DRAFT_1084550 [Mycena capillaripes]|nr:hypothetical protein B0H19DRAFT_1084550 [Mycena capillaripes]